MTVDTACSSSLVAISQAVECIRSGRAKAAVAGGVNVLLSPMGFVGFSKAHMLFPTGACRVFDERLTDMLAAKAVLSSFSRILKKHNKTVMRFMP